MTSGYDQPARSASTSSPHPNPGRPRGRPMVTLLAAAFAAAAPPAVAHARPSQPLAVELLASGALPATTAVPTATAPKIPTYVGD
jgi:hypothetical protein